MFFNGDENIFKKLIQKTCSPVIQIKCKTIIYYNKFKTSNFVISDSFPTRLEFCKKRTLYINLNVL